MSKKVLVLSSPHNGTHFTVWLLAKKLGCDVRFHHFHPNSSHLVTECLRDLDPSVPIVVPWRLESDCKASYKKRGIPIEELIICDELADYYINAYSALNWIDFEVYRCTTNLRELELVRLINKLNLSAKSPRFIKDLAYIWPEIGKKEFPEMHKYIWKEGDFRMSDFSVHCSPRDRTVDEWQAYCHGRAVKNGWWKEGEMEDPIVMASKIALIHSELSEMLEGLRKGQQDDHLPDRLCEEVEAADVFIRLMDYCGARKLDLAGAIIAKMEYNETRTDHKPDARGVAGGKKF